jgi:hypothetical protein
MDRSRRYGKCGTIPSCILDDVVSCATRAYREQIDIYRRICIRLLPQKDGTVPFYSCKRLW